MQSSPQQPSTPVRRTLITDISEAGAFLAGCFRGVQNRRPALAPGGRLVLTATAAAVWHGSTISDEELEDMIQDALAVADRYYTQQAPIQLPSKTLYTLVAPLGFLTPRSQAVFNSRAIFYLSVSRGEGFDRATPLFCDVQSLRPRVAQPINVHFANLTWIFCDAVHAAMADVLILEKATRRGDEQGVKSGRETRAQSIAYLYLVVCLAEAVHADFASHLRYTLSTVSQVYRQSAHKFLQFLDEKLVLLADPAAQFIWKAHRDFANRRGAPASLDELTEDIHYALSIAHSFAEAGVQRPQPSRPSRPAPSSLVHIDIPVSRYPSAAPPSASRASTPVPLRPSSPSSHLATGLSNLNLAGTASRATSTSRIQLPPGVRLGGGLAARFGPGAPSPASSPTLLLHIDVRARQPRRRASSSFSGRPVRSSSPVPLALPSPLSLRPRSLSSKSRSLFLRPRSLSGPGPSRSLSRPVDGSHRSHPQHRKCERSENESVGFEKEPKLRPPRRRGAVFSSLPPELVARIVHLAVPPFLPVPCDQDEHQLDHERRHDLRSLCLDNRMVGAAAREVLYRQLRLVPSDAALLTAALAKTPVYPLVRHVHAKGFGDVEETDDSVFPLVYLILALNHLGVDTLSFSAGEELMLLPLYKMHTVSTALFDGVTLVDSPSITPAPIYSSIRRLGLYEDVHLEEPNEPGEEDGGITFDLGLMLPQLVPQLEAMSLYKTSGLKFINSPFSVLDVDIRFPFIDLNNLLAYLPSTLRVLRLVHNAYTNRHPIVTRVESMLVASSFRPRLDELHLVNFPDEVDDTRQAWLAVRQHCRRKGIALKVYDPSDLGAVLDPSLWRFLDGVKTRLKLDV
ncbi:hypothetical protein JCM8097_006853 [Rhodosporidiobolus ruineniae]